MNQAPDFLHPDGAPTPPPAQPPVAAVPGEPMAAGVDLPVAGPVPVPERGPDVHQEAEAVHAAVPAEAQAPEAIEGAGPVQSDALPVAAPAAKPETAPTEPVPLRAAQDAADYVARMFQDIRAGDEAVADAPASLADGADAPTAEAPVAHVAPQAAVQGLLAGRSVLVLGLGISGLSMARWCLRCGAEVTVADSRAEPPLLARLRAELPQAAFVGGALDATLLDGRVPDAVYRSPGLAPHEIAPLLIAASAREISAGGELSLYSEALQALRSASGYVPQVLAVTGTNGKTTVTSLTAALVERSGASVAVAGNIGPALLDTLAERLDGGTLPQVWVLELSSFQLDVPAGFEPTAATVLNLSQDHLDWHGDMAAYAAAKARVFGTGGTLVVNRDDPAVMQMLADAHAALPAEPAARGRPARVPERHWIGFGSDLPRRPGDFGLEIVGGMAWLVRAQESDAPRARTQRRSGEVPQELFLQRFMPADALRIRGRHNALNALAALALAQSAGCALAPMLYGLREYRGEPHRVEPVGLIDGIEYFDDSKGTNVGATVAAIAGLGADRRVVVIMGGVGKGQDFSPLAEPVARHARAVVLIGRDAAQIRAALEGTGVALLGADTMADAVAQAAARAHAGDAVLLSPACASFDMFDDYEHRARVFCEVVQERAADAGHSLEGFA